jgi:serine/threonine protein kinase
VAGGDEDEAQADGGATRADGGTPAAADLGGATMIDPPQGDAGGATLVGDDVPLTAKDAADPVLGQTFSGCLIDKKLGQGGMGSVYIARRIADGEKVVIKFLAPEQAMNASWRARFLREAQMMQQIRHPNIVGIYSIDGESKLPHIVMELVDGIGLDALLEREGPLKPVEAARICRDTALGLAEAHKSAIIHRDIKPANILRTKAGAVKILDFGLAKSVEADESLSLPGQALGTPHYMAPEQWGDHAVDARADVYALGVTLYALVTGTVPFDGAGPQAIQHKALAGKFTRPRELNPDVTEDLELVILQAMCADRRFRYGSAHELANDLTRIVEGQPVELPRLVERVSGKRYPLVPGTSWTLGRETTCDIPVNDRSASRQHAKITREPTGFVIVDLGSSYGTSVGGMRLTRDMLLKDGDEVLLGKAAYTFRDGGRGAARQTRRLGVKPKAEKQRARLLPIPFIQALADMTDRRIVVSLIEGLAPDADDAQLEATHEMLVPILGHEVAEELRGKLQSKKKRLRARAPHQLFAITKENLGDDLDAWLGWWDHARESYPAQVGPLGLAQAQAQLRIVKGEPVERVVQLGERPVTTVGRDETCDVPVASASVSRVHASILSLNRRHAIRDEGSRFGTLVQGEKATIRLLRPNDRVVLGAVELVYEVPEPDLGATNLTESTFSVDPEAFFLLMEMKHKSVVAGLIRFCELEAERWVDEAAMWTFDDAARADQLAKRVRESYAKHAAKSKELLVELLGPAGGSLEDSQHELSVQTPDLPPQLVPAGWFPPAEWLQR